MTRRRFLKRSLQLGILSLLSTSIYGFFVERRWLHIHRLKLRFHRLPQAFRGVRIVHFSDLHLGFFMGKERLHDIVKVIDKEKPDMICFTGDLVDSRSEFIPDDLGPLAKLHARLGKYAVLGNHDSWPHRDTIIDKLTEAGFQVLINRSTKIERDGQAIYLAGIDDALNGLVNWESALRQNRPKDAFTILLAHEPDLADHAAAYDVDLQLSGHSHGGQVRLPLIGPLLTPVLGSKYVDHLYHIKGSDFKVYTSRGVGTTRIPIRLLCRPEITVIELNSQ